ncbi:MAG TPA: sugar phosphate isomerase/epimerase family protein [Atribacteraceae bacterium]|nr:sugar phosphate isomerase/epimerase family protein [Atribacteraceae bacterium]
MKLQNFQLKDREIIDRFLAIRQKPDFTGKIQQGQRLNLSWSNWGFGMEPFVDSCARLARYNVRYIELHGNWYGPDLGYKVPEISKILADYGIRVGGVCGMVSPESELSSNKPHITQRSLDYFRRTIEKCAELGGTYVLFSPAAVGRPQKYDDSEFYRAADAIRLLGDFFFQHNIRAAIEPVRAAEVSFCHTFAEAEALIRAIDHPGVQHIGGDLYHMLVGENHIPVTLVEYGHRLTNLHTAETHRGALGTGFLDIDLIIMALYCIGYNNPRCFLTPEPLGPGGDPYPAMWGRTDPDLLDALVRTTAEYFYEREKEVLEASDDELKRHITPF